MIAAISWVSPECRPGSRAFRPFEAAGQPRRNDRPPSKTTGPPPPFDFRYQPFMPLARFLGGYPRLAGNLIGGALAAVMVVIFCMAAVCLRVQQVEEGHGRLLARMRAVQDDTARLLDELNAGYRPDCTPANLRRLGGLMFTHRYVRAIGLVNQDGLLFCSTGAGLLDKPAPIGRHHIDGASGRYYLNTPVHSFVGSLEGSITAPVVQRGPFQVLVDGSVTQDVFAEYADAVWAGGGGQRRSVFRGERGALTQPFVSGTPPRLQMDWRHFRLMVTTTAPGVSPVSAQSVLGWHSVDAGRLRVLLVAAAFFGLSGYVAGNAVARRFRRYHSIEYRIARLCKPANVVCHYQPILDLVSGRMIGCEVLARLQDGDQLLYPDKFIPALNRQHLSWAFDAAVSRAALHELAAALPVQPEFTVALNFFPHNLRRNTIHAHLQSVMAQIDRTDLKIELEVTEYDFSPDLAPELRLLKADGYGISIDDFGTGYSNLGIVKKVSPDYLKIDRSFVFEMEDETIRSSLIPEIIAIARAVGSQVIAEGIETAAQHAQLRDLGVQFGQGYHFARPMAVAELQRFMAANAAQVAARSMGDTADAEQRLRQDGGNSDRPAPEARR
ncbi:EAL domain-containing protein [Xylophilus sp. Kf1]|nr:EAL domain-containing protein [Xylophilus sp. Kf1]